MAGDWLQMGVDLPEKPEVWRIAGILQIDPDTVVGKLVKVWRWFDAHTEDGNAAGVTYALVDHLTSVTGFAEAMAHAGWLVQDGYTLTLPNFSRHNGKTAKNRALTAKRVAKCKGKSNAEGNGASVTTALPKEEKRREENIEAKAAAPAAPLPDWLPPSAWGDFLAHRKAIKKPMGEGAIARMLKSLAAMQHDGVDVLGRMDESIRNGWADVYPPKTGLAPSPVNTLPAGGRRRLG